MSPLVNHRAAMPILLDNHHGDRDNEHQACRECNLRPLRSQLTSSDPFRWVSARSSVSSAGSSGWTISPLAPGHFVVRHLVIIYQTTFCQSAPGHPGPGTAAAGDATGNRGAHIWRVAGGRSRSHWTEFSRQWWLVSAPVAPDCPRRDSDCPYAVQTMRLESSKVGTSVLACTVGTWRSELVTRRTTLKFVSRSQRPPISQECRAVRAAWQSHVSTRTPLGRPCRDAHNYPLDDGASHSVEHGVTMNSVTRVRLVEIPGTPTLHRAVAAQSATSVGALRETPSANRYPAPCVWPQRKETGPGDLGATFQYHPA